MQHLDSRSPMVAKRMHVQDAGEEENGSCSSTNTNGFTHGLNATLGMVIHGAADGIALGASSRSGNGNLSLIVFLAVLVHKGELSSPCQPNM